MAENELQLDEAKAQGTSLALVSLLIGVVILSFAAIFTRLSENELGSFATSFNRFSIAFITLSLWESVVAQVKGPEHQQPEIELADWGRFLLSSLLGTCAIVSWAWSLTQTSVANSNLLHNLTPLFTTLGGWLFLSQSFDARFLLGMSLAIFGSAIIGWEDFQGNAGLVIGDGVALMSAVFYAANYLVREKLREKFSAATTLLWPSLFCGFITFWFAFLTEPQVLPSLWQTWIAVLSLGILCQGVGQGLLVYNLKRFSAGFVTLLMLLEPLLTAVFASIIFAESLSVLNWAAFALVLVGLYFTKQSKSAVKVVMDEESA